MSTKHAGVRGLADRSVPNRTRYQTAPRPDFKKPRASTASVTLRQETHAQRVYRYRRAFRGVIELFGREYDRALKAAAR
jgi:hypothetical protein